MNYTKSGNDYAHHALIFLLVSCGILTGEVEEGHHFERTLERSIALIELWMPFVRERRRFQGRRWQCPVVINPNDALHECRPVRLLARAVDNTFLNISSLPAPTEFNKAAVMTNKQSFLA